MRNPTFEQALTKQGVPWEYEGKIALADINAQRGLNNQARLLEPLDMSLVDAYAEAMKRGDEFPPLVLYRPSERAKYVPIDGNQRLAAKTKLSHTSTDAYVVGLTDPKIIDRLTWTFNNKVNGKRISQEEAVLHAVSFVRKYGEKCETAAQEWGVPHWAVAKAVKAEEVRDALGRQNVKGADKLPADKLHRLAPIINVGEDVLAKAAEVVVKTGISSNDIDALCKDVRAAKTNEAKLKAIDDFSKSDKVVLKQAETKGGTVASRTQSPAERLAAETAKILRLMEQYPDTALRPRMDYKKVREDAAAVCERYIQLFGLGRLPKEAAG